jgi:alpha-L-fucosidase 2
MKEFMSEPVRQKAYQALGDLELQCPEYPSVDHYRRLLDLDTGIAKVEFNNQRREIFASYPANVVVVRIEGETKCTPLLKFAHANGAVEGGAIRYDARFETIGDGKGVTILLAAATNFNNYRDVSADPKARVDAVLAAARTKGYERLRAEHIGDYQKLFRRVKLDLGTSPAAPIRPGTRNTPTTSTPR